MFEFTTEEISAMDLQTFAARVQDVAASPDSADGMPWDGKLFLAWVVAGLTGYGFRQRPDVGTKLVQAHQAGLLRLTRADLVEALNPADVRDSSVRFLNTTFEFLAV